jgi:hypothetical protein
MVAMLVVPPIPVCAKTFGAANSTSAPFETGEDGFGESVKQAHPLSAMRMPFID